MTPYTIKLSIRKYPIGWGAALLAIVLLFILFFRYEALQGVQLVLSEKTAEGERLKANISHSNGLSENLEQLNLANETIAKRLVKNSDLAINLQYFYKLEAETGVKLLDLRQLDIAPQKNKARGNYSAVPYTVKIQGKYMDVLLFLRRLEKGLYYTRILSANISPGGAGEGQGSENNLGVVELSLGIEVLGKPI